jgi:hypothetical protein
MALIEGHVTAQASPATTQISGQVLDPTEVFYFSQRGAHLEPPSQSPKLTSEGDSTDVLGVNQ